MRRSRNAQPEILVSTLAADSVSFADHDRPMILCPDPGCGTWAYVVRGQLKPHHRRGQVNSYGDPVRCAGGSGRRIRVDETAVEHSARLFTFLRDTCGPVNRRHATVVHGVRPAPMPPAVCQLRRAA